MMTLPQRKRIAEFLHGKRDDGLVSPTTFYAGLITGSVADDGTFSGEVSGGGYARVAITNSSSTFGTADSTATVRSLVDITFAEATTSWGNIAYVFFTNVSTGGSAQYYIPISPAKTVSAGTTVYWRGDPTGATGDIRLTVSNG